METHSSTLAWKIPWTDGGAWQATVHGIAKSWTQLSHFTFTLCSNFCVISLALSSKPFIAFLIPVILHLSAKISLFIF